MNLTDVPFEEIRRIARLHRLRLLDAPPERVIDACVAMVGAATGLPVAVLSLVDAERQWLQSATGLPASRSLPRGGSFVEHVLAADGICEVEDARHDARFAACPLVAGTSRAAHCVGVPIAMPEGERVGVLCALSPEPGRLDARALAQLKAAARTVVQVLLLRESERELREENALAGAEVLAEFAPVGMFWADGQGRLLHANREWLAMMGFASLAQGLDSGWVHAVHAEDLEALRERWLAAVAARESCTGSFRVRVAHGEPARWLKFRAEPVRTATGAAFVGAAVDITESMWLQDQLVAKNRLLESIIENLPCGVAVFDADLRHLTSNPKARAMLDLPSDVLDGPDVTFASVARFLAARGEYGPGDVEELVAQRLATLRRPHARERVRADGTVIQIRGSALPGGGWVTTYTDLTSERRAAAELATSQRRLSRALEASSMALWEYDTVRREFHFSEGWARLLQLPPLDPVLPAGQVEAFMNPPEIGRLRDLHRKLLRGEVERMDAEHAVQAANGELVWLHSMAQVSERDADGRALRVVGTCKDVTARRQSEAALHAALDAAGEASRAKSDFLATMSHEIRTPINGVIGLAQLLGHADLPDSESGYVRMIGSCAKSLLSLVDNILDFSKIEAGRMQLSLAAMELRPMLDEIADVFAVRAAEKDIRFDCTVAGEVPSWIHGDSARLRQVLLNLLGNALKFTGTGGFALEVRVRASRTSETLMFTVRDSGIGISQVDQARLFTRFTQTDGSASRKYDGTGLGLAISRQLAQLMGGDISLVSWPGLGSSFTLAIPLRRADAPSPPQEPRPLEAALVSASVLLVEDNMVNQVVARGLLASLGYTRVTVAANGVEALEACERAAFDLVLMDCQMPEMDGLRATRILRQRGVRTPIVALTASAVSGDRARCLEAGMDDYLTKPIEPRLLAEKLHRWLASAPQAAPAPRAPAGASRELPSAPFDRTALQERFFNDCSLFEECRRIFVRQTPGALEDLRGCFEVGDLVRARSLAHSVKGSAATIGAQRLADCCGGIERALDPMGEGATAAAEWLARARPALAAFVEASAVVSGSTA